MTDKARTVRQRMATSPEFREAMKTLKDSLAEGLCPLHGEMLGEDGGCDECRRVVEQESDRYHGREMPDEDRDSDLAF